MSLHKENIKNLRLLAKSYNIVRYSTYSKADIIFEIQRAIHENFQNPSNLGSIFPFSDDLYETKKKRRHIKEKCSCGEYISIAYKRQHLQSSRNHSKINDNL